MFHALGFMQAIVGVGLGSTLVVRRRYDPETMYLELWNIAEASISDVPLRRLVLTILSDPSL